MSMMCVTPACATFAILSDVQIPPPTATRSVNHVISIPVLCRADFAACLKISSAARRDSDIRGENPVLRDAGEKGRTAQGETETPDCQRTPTLRTTLPHSTGLIPPTQ